MLRRLMVVFLMFAGVLVRPAGSLAGQREVITGGITTHIVAAAETLTSIAARSGVDPSTIVSDNRLGGQALERGRTLRIDNRHIVPITIVAGEILVNVPQRMLFFVQDEHVIGYPVAVGRATWQTPRGPFTVVQKEEDPTWHVPPSIRAESARMGRLLPLVVPPGPRNPLGRFWIGLSLAGIGVHGTPVPSSIRRVDVGTRGRIVYEPVQD